MEQTEKKPRDYVWDLTLSLSPNAVNHLLMCLKATEDHRGLEPWETSLHSFLHESLANLRANAT